MTDYQDYRQQLSHGHWWRPKFTFELMMSQLVSESCPWTMVHNGIMIRNKTASIRPGKRGDETYKISPRSVGDYCFGSLDIRCCKYLKRCNQISLLLHLEGPNDHLVGNQEVILGFLAHWPAKPMSLSNHKWQITWHLSVDTFQIEHTETTSNHPYYPLPITTPNTLTHHHPYYPPSHPCYPLSTPPLLPYPPLTLISTFA